MATLVSVINQVQLTLLALNPAITVGFGSAQRAQRAVPPMVTWVPTTDGFESSAEQHLGTAKAAPRIVANRLAGCEAHLWGAVTNQVDEDFSATEALVEQVVCALRASLKARDLVDLRGAWKDAGGAEAVSFGRAYVLSFVIRLPIAEQGVVGSTATVTAVPQTNRPVLADAIDWTQNTAYPTAQQLLYPQQLVVANGSLYRLVTPGTSASTGTGPAGTGSTISDGTGTLVWAYVSPAVNI